MALTYEGWLERNPLRQWINEARVRGRRSAPAVARQLHVSKQAVYKWLDGTFFPDPESMRGLQEFTGITEASWMAWWKVKPRLRKERKAV